MATYYVDKVNGNDGGAGGPSTPWRTIRRSFSTMAADDVCYIRGGTYAEKLDTEIVAMPSGTAGHLIKWQAYPGETVILDIQGWHHCLSTGGASFQHWSDFTLDTRNGSVWQASNPSSTCAMGLSGGPDSIFENMEIIGSYNNIQRGLGVTSGLRTLFKNLYVHDFSSHGGYISGDDCIVDGCRFDSNGQFDGSTNGAAPGISGYGIQFYWGPAQPQNVIIRNSIVSRNLLTGISMHGPSNAAYNNLVYGNAYYGIEADRDALIAFNSIYANGDWSVYCVGGHAAVITLKNNLGWASVRNDGRQPDTGVTLIESNNLWGVDPGCVDPSNGDFNLSSMSSPANGAGVAIPGITTDYYGRTRPNPPSIGAAEFGSIVSQPEVFWGSILGKIFKDVDIAIPSVSITLHSADPGLTGANELTASWYSRQTAGHTAWNAAANRRITNANAISWTTDAAWNVTHFGVRTAAGEWISGHALDAPKSGVAGKVINFAAGTLQVFLGYGSVTPTGTSGMSTYLANKVLDYIFRGVDFLTAPVNVSFHTADPGLTGASELSGSGYARQPANIVDWPDRAESLDSGNLINYRYEGIISTTVPTCRVTHAGYWSGANWLFGIFAWPDSLGIPQAYKDFTAGETLTVDPASFAQGGLNASIVLNN